MNLTYKRRWYRSDGIFSEATDDTTGKLFMVVLEHAFWDLTQQKFLPILQPGEYDCVRGMHRLHGMDEDFETFEIQGVADQNNKAHAGVLFHWGNWNTNSEGCSLLGEKIAMGDDPRDALPNTPVEMVTNSRTTFKRFMEAQAGLTHFKLTVKG